MERILGLDFGAKTVGVAVSDPLGITAQGVEIIRRKSESKLRKTLARLEEIAAQYGAVRVVVGLPKHMSGESGERAQKSEAFAEAVSRRLGVPAEMWDERLTTVQADRIMDELGLRGADRKEVVDEIAAVLILQSYLDRMNSAGEPVQHKETT